MTYHYSKLIGVLNNYDVALEANKMQLHSQGSAYSENQKRMDSFEGRLGKLKTTVESFWNSSINSDLFKGMISGLTVLIDKFGNLGTVLSLIGTGLALWKGNEILSFFKTLPASISTSIKEMTLFKNIALAMELRELGLLTTTQLLSSSFKALGISIKNAFLSNPLGWIAMGFTAVTMAVDMFGQKAEESKQQIKDSIEAYKSLNTEVDSLTATYIEIGDKWKTDNDEKKKLIETETRLKEIFGESAKALNLQTGTVDDNIKKFKELKAIKDAEFLLENKTKINNAKDRLSSYKSESFFSDSPADTLNLAPELLGKIFAGNPKQVLAQLESELALLGKRLDEVKAKGTPFDVNQYSYSFDLVNAKIKEYKENIKPDTDLLEQADQKEKAIAETKILNLDKLNEKQTAVYTNLKNFVKYSNADQYQKDLQQVQVILSSFDGKNVAEVEQQLRAIANLPNKDIETVMKSLADGTYKSGKSAEESKKAEEELNKTISNSINNIQTLNSAQDELNENHKLSTQTLESVANKYPELLAYMNDEVLMSQKIQEKIKQEKDDYVDASYKKIESNQSFFDNVIKNDKELWSTLSDAYGDDLKNFKSLEDAKLEIDNEISAQILTNWMQLDATTKEIMRTNIDLLGEALGSDVPNGQDSYDLAMKASTGMMKAGATEDDVAKAVDSGAALKVNKMKKALDTAKAKTDEIFRNANFGDGRKSSGSTSAGSSSPAINEEVYKVEKDRYMGLNQVLTSVNNSLEKNQALQKNATIEERVKLIAEEIELLRQKRKAINDIAWEQSQEAKEKKAYLEKNNVKFDQNGNIDKASYDSVIDSIANNTESMKRKGNATKIAENNQLLKNLEQANKDYLSATANAAKSINERESLTGDIFAKQNDKTKAEIESVLAPLGEHLTDLNDQLTGLQSKYDLLGESEFDSKIENINKQIVNQKLALIDTDKALSELRAKYNKQDTNAIEKKEILKEIVKLENDSLSIKKTMVALGDKRADQLKEDTEKALNEKDLAIEKIGEIETEGQIAKKISLIKEKISARTGYIDEVNAYTKRLEYNKENEKSDIFVSQNSTGAKYLKELPAMQKANANDLKEINTLNLELAKKQVEKFDLALEELSATTSKFKEELDFLKEWQPQNFESINTLISGVITNTQAEINQLKTMETSYIAKRDQARQDGDIESFKLFDDLLKKTYQNEQNKIMENAKLKKEQLQNSFSEQNRNIEKLLFGDSSQKAEQDRINSLKKEQDTYISGEEKVYALNLMRTELNKYNSDIQNKKITIYDAELDRLEKIDKITRDDLDTLKKKIEIKQLELKLDNLREEKTIKVLRKQADGKYAWKFEADQGAINETESQLASSRIDLIKTQKDKSIKAQEDDLNQKIDYMNEVKEIQQKALNGEYKTQEEFTADMTRVNGKLSTNYKNMWFGITSTQANASVLMNDYQSNIVTSYATFTTSMKELSASLSESVQNSANALLNSVAQLEELARRAEAARATITGQAMVSFTGGSIKNGVPQPENRPSSSANINTTLKNAWTNIQGYHADGIESGAVTKNGTYMLHGSESSPEWVLTTEQMKTFIRNMASKASSSFTIKKPLAPSFYNSGDTSNVKSEVYSFNIDTIQTNDVTNLINSMKRKIRSN